MRTIYPSDWTKEQIAGYVPDPQLSNDYDISSSEDDIRKYLHGVRKCIRGGQFIVDLGDPRDPSDTRNKNNDFLNIYSLSDKDVQGILLSIDELDFCYVIPAGGQRKLYVFCKELLLSKTASESESEKVAVYIKHDYDQSVEYDVVISFHALEHPIEMIFVD